MRLILSFLLAALLLSACGNSENTGKADAGQKPDSTAAPEKKTILFFGNSLTAGYGLDDPNDAFPGLIQQRLDSLNLPYKAVNAGLSGETSSGGNSRIEWLLKQEVGVFVLELGANDGLRGIPVSETEANLQSIITKVKTKYPGAKILLLGMQVPPNMGKSYATQFREVFARLAQKNNAALVPFLLEGVGGVRELNQGDGIHPTPEGQKILADNVWKELEKLL